jgi:hypothetical protein
MAPLRALLYPLLAGCLLALAACSTPPPARVTTRTVYKINTALLLTSDDGKLTAEQLQTKRDEVVRYLTERGLLSPDDVLVANAAAADRIIRVSIAESGGFKVTIFNPGSTGAYYSAAPALSGNVRVHVGSNDYWPSYDPWFDQGYYYSPYPSPGYYRYQPRDYLRPHYPRDYHHPVEPRHTPPPPVISDPTPQPHPRLPRHHDNDIPRPNPRDPDRANRPDWRDSHSPTRPHDADRAGDFHPRPERVAPPPPAPPPPTRADPPPRSEPPRDAEPRHPREDDRRDYPPK